MNRRRLKRTLSAVKEVSCSCGYVAAGETADELLTAVEAHIAASHAPESTVASQLSATQEEEER
jgi:predicted small metal-binding protein